MILKTGKQTRLWEEVQPAARRRQARRQRHGGLAQARAALHRQHLAAGKELPAAEGQG